MNNIQSIFSINYSIAVVLIVLVIPIFCSAATKVPIKRSKENIRSGHLKSIQNKEIDEYIAPQSPYHFSGYFSADYYYFDLYILDSTINIFRRGKDFYYKWVFTYERTVNNDNSIALKKIKLDEDKSVFFSNDDEVECGGEKGCETHL